MDDVIDAYLNGSIDGIPFVGHQEGSLRCLSPIKPPVQ